MWIMFGRKRLPIDAPPLGPDDAMVVLGDVVTRFDNKNLYEECVLQHEEFMKWMAEITLDVH